LKRVEEKNLKLEVRVAFDDVSSIICCCAHKTVRTHVAVIEINIEQVRRPLFREKRGTRKQHHRRETTVSESPEGPLPRSLPPRGAQVSIRSSLSRGFRVPA